ncbi:hypothetical protein [Pseudofrankia inefficax]|uniref:Uncharacterized protein n=1 Tax=Pseudofrankia inefficax (strain DSM 45817 / CECT 9037 / DDB 130130 / EuI1c) TaxID=298654 RepID=E3ITY1_PSEI1|nr:hypothetical protein [Pseudofrankia inefficax]ADP80028.1 hypothetical protein FraEuI1c_1978 [Pseudofrankia inefficax]
MDQSAFAASTSDLDSGMSALDHALARRASADGDLVSGAYVHNSGPCLFRPRHSSSTSASRLTDTKN